MKQLTVRSGKDDKDRFTTFPPCALRCSRTTWPGSRRCISRIRRKGHGEVYLPHALARKFPHIAKEWGWQYIFPARDIAVDPRSGVTRRHHVDPSIINKAIKVAVRRAGLTKTISAHTFRHFLATHLLQRGTAIRTIQPRLGHNDLTTTMIYTRILQQGGHGVRSPLDDLGV
jgi:integrase